MKIMSQNNTVNNTNDNTVFVKQPWQIKNKTFNTLIFIKETNVSGFFLYLNVTAETQKPFAIIRNMYLCTLKRQTYEQGSHSVGHFLYRQHLNLLENLQMDFIENAASTTAYEGDVFDNTEHIPICHLNGLYCALHVQQMSTSRSIYYSNG